MSEKMTAPHLHDILLCSAGITQRALSVLKYVESYYIEMFLYAVFSSIKSSFT